jgi:hypothetical protein
VKITEITAENRADLSREDLLAAVTEGETALDALLANDDLSAEQVAEAAALNQSILDVNGYIGELDAAEQAQADELQALRDARAERAAAAEQAAQEPEVVEEPQQPETDATVETPEVVEVVEPVAAATPPVAVVEAPVVIDTPAPEAVAASARDNLAGRRPAPSPERTNQKESTVGKMTPALIASAENGLTAAGAEVTFADFRNIAQRKLQAARGSRSRQTSQVGVFAMKTPELLEVHEKSTQDQMNEAILHAVSIDRVREEAGLTASVGHDAESLTAAGWCAPSETVYDLCEGGSREGLFDLPEITVNRGGINFTQGLDFSELYADTFGWDITEAEMDAETFTKACVSVPCPDFEEVRLNAVGMCVTSDLLPKAAYPELEQAFLAEALIAFDHKKSRKQFNAVLAASTAAVTAGTLGSVAASTLAAVELVIEGERRKYRWPSSQVMEVVVPHWAKAAFRGDLSNRTGVVEFAVTDQMIDSWFALRGARVQYIYDYTGFLLAENVATMPTSMQVLVYKAGTFVTGAAPVISLGTVYDSTLLAENKHMALFYEQGLLLLKRCYGSRRITIPVCAAGRSGIANLACA